MEKHSLEEIIQKYWSQMSLAAAFLMQWGAHKRTVLDHERRIKELEDEHKSIRADLTEVKEKVAEMHGFVKAMYEKTIK